MQRVILLTDDADGHGSTGPTPETWKRLQDRFGATIDLHRGLIVYEQHFMEGEMVSIRKVAERVSSYAFDGCACVLIDYEKHLWDCLVSPAAKLTLRQYHTEMDDVLVQAARGAASEIPVGIYGRPWFGPPRDPSTIQHWSQSELAIDGMRHIDGILDHGGMICPALYQPSGYDRREWGRWIDKAITANRMLSLAVQQRYGRLPLSSPVMCPLVYDGSRRSELIDLADAEVNLLTCGEDCAFYCDQILVWLAPRWSKWRGTISPVDSHANDLWTYDTYAKWLEPLEAK